MEITVNITPKPSITQISVIIPDMPVPSTTHFRSASTA
jgi:hypothetical protein